MYCLLTHDSLCEDFFFGRESFLQGEFQASANAHYSASLRFAPQLAFQARPSIPPRSLIAELTFLRIKKSCGKIPIRYAIIIPCHQSD